MRILSLGLPGEQRDKLIQAVLDGKKTATSSPLSSWKNKLPPIGEQEILIDSKNKPIAIIEITDIKTLPIEEVNVSIVQAEGEDFRDVEHWRKEHERFWLGEKYDKNYLEWQIPDNEEVVIEYFKVLKPL